MIALVDTGFVIALEVKSDRNRRRCIAVFQRVRLAYLPQSVLNEVCYLLTKAGGNRAAASFLRRLPEMKYVLIRLEPEDIERTADLLDQYADSRVDFVDATVAAIAERLHIQTILTLDQRDFGIIRPAHVDFFEILPR